jgi:hypothetical protein
MHLLASVHDAEKVLAPFDPLTARPSRRAAVAPAEFGVKLLLDAEAAAHVGTITRAVLGQAQHGLASVRVVCGHAQTQMTSSPAIGSS